MKKNWNNPELKNLSVGCTNEGGCPAATGEKHGFGPFPDCEHYCAVCGGCKLYPFMQNLCLANAINPIKHCENACNGGCQTPQS